MLTAGWVVNQETCLSYTSLVSAIPRLRENVRELSCQARGKSWEHSGSAGEHDVLDERLEIVHFAHVETVINLLVESTVFNASQLRSKHALGSLETFATDLDKRSIGEHVLLIVKSSLISQVAVFNWVIGYKALCFFDFPDSLKISRRIKSISTLSQKLDQVFGDVSSGKVKSLDCVSEDVTINNRNHVRNTIARIQDQSSAQTFSHEGKKGLSLKKTRSEVLLFEKGLCHFNSILSWIEGSFSDKQELITPIAWQSQLLCERVVP